MYPPAQVTNWKGGPSFTDEGRVSPIWKAGNFDMALERGLDKMAKEKSSYASKIRNGADSQVREL